METIQFIYQNLGLLGMRTLEHISLVGIAVGVVDHSPVEPDLATRRGIQAGDDLREGRFAAAVD